MRRLLIIIQLNPTLEFVFCILDIPVISEFCRFGRVSRRPGMVSTQIRNSAESAEFLVDSYAELRGEERSQLQ